MLPERVLQRVLGQHGWERRGWSFIKSWKFGKVPDELHYDERQYERSRWAVTLSATPVIQHQRGKRRFSFVLKLFGLNVENNLAGSAHGIGFRSHSHGYTRVTLTALSQRVSVQRTWFEWAESHEQYAYNRDLQQRKWDAMEAAMLAQGCPHVGWFHKPERPDRPERTVLYVNGDAVGTGPDPAKAGVLKCMNFSKGVDCRQPSEHGAWKVPTTYYFHEELMAFLDTPYMNEKES